MQCIRRSRIEDNAVESEQEARWKFRRAFLFAEVCFAKVVQQRCAVQIKNGSGCPEPFLSNSLSRAAKLLLLLRSFFLCGFLFGCHRLILPYIKIRIPLARECACDTFIRLFQRNVKKKIHKRTA